MKKNGTVIISALLTLCLFIGSFIIMPKTIAASTTPAVSDYSAVFDATYYYNSYPDLQHNIGNDPATLLNHFITSGMKEGRNGNSSFDVRAYMYNNPDLLAVYGADDYSDYYIHYICNGQTEKRTALYKPGTAPGLNVLASYTTKYNTTEPRAINVELAAARVNGLTIAPGESFSFSNSVGTRTIENGYVEAGSYLNGETVQTYGGGICQVSSTLYNAIILAELEVTERWPHSMTVSYVKESMDAAIAEGYKDLKFKNNTDTPIYIEGYTYGGRVTFTIYGKETRPEGRKVSYVNEIISKTEAKKKFEATEDPVGTFEEKEAGHYAIKAKLWKIVTENGVEVSKKTMNTSSYQSSSAIWSVGIGTDHAQAKELLINAIKTQDEAKIQEAITQAQALIVAPQ